MNEQFAVVVLCLSSFALWPGCEGIIPKVCAHNVTLVPAVCCPAPVHSLEVCGGLDRGSCELISAPDQQVPSVFSVDDRIGWPTKFFQYGCRCKDNFYGLACEQCWFGWDGPSCDKRKVYLRRNIRYLRPQELRIFNAVFYESLHAPSDYVILDEKDNTRSDPLRNPLFIQVSVQHYLVFLHRYGSRTTLYENEDDCLKFGILNFNHDGVVFPTWHRYYNLVWELELRKIAVRLFGDHNFTMPYWDWTGKDHCDICTNEYVGAPGKTDIQGTRIHSSSIYFNWTEYCYEPEDLMLCYGCQKSGRIGNLTRSWNRLDFPTIKDINFLMTLSKYFVIGERDSSDCASFHMALEGFCGRPEADGSGLYMHNKIHIMVDGSMCCTSTSTNDPIFPLHHTQVDRMFEFWLRRYQPSATDFPNEGVRPGHCRDCNMLGFIPAVRNVDMLTSNLNLGYEYEDYLFGGERISGDSNTEHK